MPSTTSLPEDTERSLSVLALLNTGVVTTFIVGNVAEFVDCLARPRWLMGRLDHRARQSQYRDDNHG